MKIKRKETKEGKFRDGVQHLFIKSNIMEEQIALSRLEHPPIEADDVPEVDLGNLLREPCHIDVGSLPTHEAPIVGVQVPHLDHGEDLLGCMGIVAVWARVHDGDLEADELIDHLIRPV